MNEEVKIAALRFIMALNSKSKEEIAEARLNLFDAALTKQATAPTEEDNIELDLKKLIEATNATPNAPITAIYKGFIAGLNAGLNVGELILNA